jgi:hypothetical protein
MRDGSESTGASESLFTRRTDDVPGQPADRAPEELLADLDRRVSGSRQQSDGRTYVARRGVLDQTTRDLASFVREYLHERRR